MENAELRTVNEWWQTLQEDFKRLNQNYQDYLRDFYSGKTEKLMKSVEFMVHKDKFIKYLNEFVQELQRHSKRMEQLLEKICAHTARFQKSRQDDLTERILSYVRENAFSPELSLERLGDEFGLSPYYISRFITEQTGYNLKSYITRLRMEEAKRLLVSTELTLQEIVNRIGYLDTSSFIRKFKRETGKTPGEYRGEQK